MTKRLKSTVLHSTRAAISKKNKHRVVRNISSSEVGKVIAIYGGFCLLKMMKCRRRQATGPQKFKKLSTVIFSFFVSGSGSGGSRSGSARCGSGRGSG